MNKIWKVWILFGIIMIIILGGFAIVPHLENFKLPDISFESPPEQITVHVGEVIGHADNTNYVLKAIYGNEIEISREKAGYSPIITTYYIDQNENINLDYGIATLRIIAYSPTWITFELIK